MALTVTISRSQFQAVPVSGFRGRLIKIVPGASDYTTGGYAISPNSVGMSEILAVIPVGSDNTAQTVAVTWQYNVQTGKLQAFGAAGGATGLTEIANAGDVSASKGHFLVLGV